MNLDAERVFDRIVLGAFVLAAVVAAAVFGLFYFRP